MNRLVEKCAFGVLVLVALSGPLFVILAAFPVAFAVAGIAVAAGIVRGVVRWFNRRDDPRLVRLPTEPQ